jgi:hypothetical protein
VRSRIAATALFAAGLCAGGVFTRGVAFADPPPAATTAWVNGTVVDDAGKPLCGVDVRVVRDKPAGTWAAVTDARGFFAVRGVPAGDALLVFSARGRVPVKKTVVVPATGTVSSEAKLVPGVRFAGKVVDLEGKPIRGVSLLAFEGESEKESRGFRSSPAGIPGGAGSSKEDGSFEVDGLTAGAEYRLRAEHPHWQILDVPGLDARAGGGHDELDLVLEPAAWVSGVVVDASGAPVAGARVLRPGEESEASEEEEWWFRLFRMTFPKETAKEASLTDVRGRFVLGSLREGSVRVVAQADGYFDGNVTTESLVTGKETPGLKIVLEVATAWVEGETVDDQGKPVAGAAVSATSDEGGRSAATSDAAGKWKLSRVRSRGPVNVSASREGHVAVHKRSVPLNSRGVKLVLSRAGRLRVRVLDEKGGHLFGVSLRWVAQSEGGRPATTWHSMQQKPEGAQIELPVGEVEVYASADGFEETALGTFQAEAGKTIDAGTVKLKRATASDDDDDD